MSLPTSQFTREFTASQTQSPLLYLKSQFTSQFTHTHTKMSPTSNSQNTPTILLLLLLLPLITLTASLDITQILSHYPDLTHFTSLLSSTGITPDINHRTSVTILAVPNSHLTPPTSPSSLADVLRFHVILQYLSFSDLRKIQPPGALFTTLLQTTGRAPNNLGALNFTFNPVSGVVSFHPINNNSVSSNVIELVHTVPYNLSVFTVDKLLEPYGFDLMASEARPPTPSVNITQALLNGHDFNVAASMLMASGVNEEFERDEDGAGITFFVPTDTAFANLPSSVNLQALPADKKSLVLKFHVLHSYYPLGSLESIVNPSQPTLATEDFGAGSFTLNISRVNGSVAINTGLVESVVVTQTVFDQNPVAIFGVSSVLLPKEIFGKDSEIDIGSGVGGGPFITAQPPDIVSGPVTAPFIELSGPSASPPLASQGSSIGGRDRGVLGLLSIGGLLSLSLLLLEFF